MDGLRLMYIALGFWMDGGAADICIDVLLLFCNYGHNCFTIDCYIHSTILVFFLYC